MRAWGSEYSTSRTRFKYYSLEKSSVWIVGIDIDGLTFDDDLKIDLFGIVDVKWELIPSEKHVESEDIDAVVESWSMYIT